MKYIDIDSTYRNRNDFPNPGNFNVLLSQSGGRNTSTTALDYIVDSFPIHGDGVITFAGGAAGAPVLDATTSTQDNFYVNHYLEDITLGEFRLITNYDGGTRTATLASAFGGGWAAGDTYYIRKGIPFRQNTLVGATTTVATLDAAASAVDDEYNGLYIWFPTTGEVRIITDYDGGTQTATLNQPIAAALGAVAYELLSFSRDNANPMTMDRSSASHQEMICYNVELVHLIIPNTTLAVYNGGTVNDYPYIYVDIGKLSGSTPDNHHLIASNNPNSVRATFKLPVVDVSNVASDFVKIACDHPPQTMKFRPTDNLYFAVRLPNGEFFTPSLADNVSPLEPNPALQISAMFGYYKL